MFSKKSHPFIIRLLSADSGIPTTMIYYNSFRSIVKAGNSSDKILLDFAEFKTQVSGCLTGSAGSGRVQQEHGYDR